MRLTRLSAISAAAVALTALPQPSALALGGDPDRSYGSSGSTSANDSTGGNRSLFSDGAGNAVVAADTTLAFFTSTGTRTGTGDFGGVRFQKAAAQDNQGRVLIAGWGSDQLMHVDRHTATGAMDTTFGTGGTVVISSLDAYKPVTMAVAADDSVAVAADGQLARLTASGALDTAWNPTGTTPGIITVPAALTRLRFQSTGALLAVCADWSTTDPCLLRYAAGDGSLDSSFGVAGKAPGFAGQTSHQLGYTDVLVAADGSLIAGGADYEVGQPILARYTADGQVDTAWGTQGLSREPTLVSVDRGARVTSMVWAPEGGIYAAVTWLPQQVVKYTAAGTRDTSFGNGGAATIPDPVGYDTAVAGMAIAGDGGLLMMRDDSRQYRISKLTTSGLAPVTGLVATPTEAGVHLAWTNPTTASFRLAEVRTNAGTAPPTASTGAFATSTAGTTADVAIPAGADRAVTVFVRDFADNASTGASMVLRGSRLSTPTGGGTRAYGITRAVTATLTRSDGAALAGQRVGVFTRRHGTSTWTRVTLSTTSSTGIATYSFKPNVNTDVQLRFAGAGTVLHSASPITVLYVTSVISATWSRTSFPLGGSAKVTGYVAPNQAGQSVYLQRYVSGAWRTVTRAALTSSSAYTFTVKPTSKGGVLYRVYKPADALRQASTSATTKLSVY